MKKFLAVLLTLAMVFSLNGFAFASWIARLPTVRDQLALRPAEVGLVLFIGSIGSAVALPLTGIPALTHE